MASRVLSAGRGILLLELLHQNVFRFLVTQGKAAAVARLPGTQKLAYLSLGNSPDRGSTCQKAIEHLFQHEVQSADRRL